MDTVDALRNLLKNEPSSVLWFDLFSNNQHLAPSLDFDWWCSTFKTAIEQFGHTIIVLSPWNKPVPFTRAWCLFELYCTAACDCKLDIAMVTAEVSDFLENVIHDTEVYFRMLSNIDVSKSESLNRCDQEKIFEVVEKTIGFEEINKIISSRMQKWVVTSLQDSFQNSPADKKIKLKVALAEIFRLQGSHVEALDQYRKVLNEVHAVGHSDLDWVLASCYNGIGQVYGCRGKYKESLEYYQKSLEHVSSIEGGIKKNVGQILNNIAVSHASQNMYSEAIDYYQKALTALIPQLGSIHPDIGAIYNNMAAVYSDRNMFDDALTCFEKSLQIDTAVLGENHPHIGGTLSNIARTEDSLQRYDDALLHYKKALKICLHSLGSVHPSVGGIYLNMAVVYMSCADIDNMKACYGKALEIFTQTYGKLHHSVADIHSDIGSILANEGKFSEALAHFEEAFQIFSTLEEHDENLGKICNDIAMIYYTLENYESSLEYFTKSLEIRIPLLGPQHADIATTYKYQGIVSQYMSRFEEALAYYQKSLGVVKSLFIDDEYPEIIDIYDRLANVYDSLGNYREAAKYRGLLPP